MTVLREWVNESNLVFPKDLLWIVVDYVRSHYLLQRVREIDWDKADMPVTVANHTGDGAFDLAYFISAHNLTDSPGPWSFDIHNFQGGRILIGIAFDPKHTDFNHLACTLPTAEIWLQGGHSGFSTLAAVWQQKFVTPLVSPVSISVDLARKEVCFYLREYPTERHVVDFSKHFPHLNLALARPFIQFFGFTASASFHH